MRPLSLDLRQRIVDAYQRGEGTQRALALRFDVGAATVERLLRQWRQTGALTPRTSPGRTPLLSTEEREIVRAWISEMPDLTQSELAERFEEHTGRRVSRRTMGRMRQSLGLTRKKRC